MTKQKPKIEADWDEYEKDVRICIIDLGGFTREELLELIDSKISAKHSSDLKYIQNVIKRLFSDEAKAKKAKTKKKKSANRKICKAKNPTEFKSDTTYNVEQLKILQKKYSKRTGKENSLIRGRISSRLSYYKRH